MADKSIHPKSKDNSQTIGKSHSKETLRKAKSSLTATPLTSGKANDLGITNLKDRGQMTISPPTKVKFDKNAECLAFNFDTLVLGLYVKWNHTKFFDYLSDIKNKAVESGKEMPVALLNKGGDDSYYFCMKEHGAIGYEWLMYDKEYALKVGNWTEPILRPSIIIEIRSETLWRKGFVDAVGDIIEVLRIEGASVSDVIVSRVDMCCDIILDASMWREELADYRVTRARLQNKYTENDKLSGIMIGKGNISARIYDKLLEIRRKSRKYWMFDVWQINEVPTGSNIIRVEFQLRRDALKGLGIDTFTELKKHQENLWAYCTQSWLKFQNNPGSHHTQRQTLEWWKIVQNAFLKNTMPYPLIRAKAISTDLNWALSQIYGYMTSAAALVYLFDWDDKGKEPSIESICDLVKNYVKENEDKIGSFSEGFHIKIAKFHRSKEKYDRLHCEKTEKGFPSSPFTVYWPNKKKDDQSQ